MPLRERSAVFQILRDWLCMTNPAATVMRLDPDTDLIEARVLESLQVVEFILFLERESGRNILAEDLNPATLRTLDSIFVNFFEPA